jgi:E3 ubiquitin-protein ligase RNF216
MWTNWLGTIKSSLTRQWKGAPPPTPNIVDSILQAERRYAETKTNELVRIKKLAYQRRVNKERAIKDGTAVDCQCCFDGSAIEDMIGCLVEGHLFCVSCVQSYAQNVMFDSGNLGVDPRTKRPSLEMLCFHGDGCTSSFHRKELEEQLPRTVMQKYDEVQFTTTMNQAGLADDLASCPQCNFQAMVHPSVRVFVCPVDSCRYESCRECGDEAHVPLRCDEVEKKHETASRLKVEEAISRAKIRVCPKCKKGFVKRFVCMFIRLLLTRSFRSLRVLDLVCSEGCNRITCSCGASICYVCRHLMHACACRSTHIRHIGKWNLDPMVVFNARFIHVHLSFTHCPQIWEKAMNKRCAKPQSLLLARKKWRITSKLMLRVSYVSQNKQVLCACANSFRTNAVSKAFAQNSNLMTCSCFKVWHYRCPVSLCSSDPWHQSDWTQ